MKLIIKDIHTKEEKEILFSIRHFRNREINKRRWSQYGGYTVMTVNGPKTPFVVVSSCSDEDTYNRKLGIEHCIREFLRRNDYIPDWLNIQADKHEWPLGDAVTIDFDKNGKVYTVQCHYRDQHKYL